VGGIVVGYIPTREGLAALEHAIGLAKNTGERLVVLNCPHHGSFAHPNFAEPQDIDAIEAELTSVGIDHDVRQPTSGREASEEIIAVATEVDADLIVIGLRRRSPVGKLLTGSTAQMILLDAPCPVLSVKPES